MKSWCSILTGKSLNHKFCTKSTGWIKSIDGWSNNQPECFLPTSSDSIYFDLVMIASKSDYKTNKKLNYNIFKVWGFHN